MVIKDLFNTIVEVDHNNKLTSFEIIVDYNDEILTSWWVNDNNNKGIRDAGSTAQLFGREMKNWFASMKKLF